MALDKQCFTVVDITREQRRLTGLKVTETGAEVKTVSGAMIDLFQKKKIPEGPFPTGIILFPDCINLSSYLLMQRYD